MQTRREYVITKILHAMKRKPDPDFFFSHSPAKTSSRWISTVNIWYRVILGIIRFVWKTWTYFESMRKTSFRIFQSSEITKNWIIVASFLFRSLTHCARAGKLLSIERTDQSMGNSDSSFEIRPLCRSACYIETISPSDLIRLCVGRHHESRERKSVDRSIC